jgi:predicted ArsR family transcriptional regulator
MINAKCQHCGLEFKVPSERNEREVKILNALIAPMTYRQISEATGIPVTPVRNIILRLEAEGAVRHIPIQGARAAHYHKCET